MTVLNKTTSLVAPREVLAEVNTQAPEAGDHFQRSNCGSPIVKGGKWYLFFYRKSSIMPDGQRCNRLLLCCPKTSPYESCGSGQKSHEGEQERAQHTSRCWACGEANGEEHIVRILTICGLAVMKSSAQLQREVSSSGV